MLPHLTGCFDHIADRHRRTREERPSVDQLRRSETSAKVAGWTRCSEKGVIMRRVRTCFLIVTVAAIVSCGTIKLNGMYDPNAAVVPIDVSTSGNVDSSDRTIVLPPGGDDLLLALENALSKDGWTIRKTTTNTRYIVRIETKVWNDGQALSYIGLTITDQSTGAEILSGTRQSKSPLDTPIDVKAVAELVTSTLKKISVPSTDKVGSPSS